MGFLKKYLSLNLPKYETISLRLELLKSDDKQQFRISWMYLKSVLCYMERYLN